MQEEIQKESEEICKVDQNSTSSVRDSFYRDILGISTNQNFHIPLRVCLNSGVVESVTVLSRASNIFFAGSLFFPHI